MKDAQRLASFGEFELDFRAHELRRGGATAPLEGRAMALLMLLVERRGELVTRDEIVARLWGTDAFVDVESGIHTAVRKLRQALGDQVGAPRYVKTVQGKGYRFIAPVGSGPADLPAPRPQHAWLRWSRVALGATAALGLILLLLALAPRPPTRPRVEVTALRPLSADAGSRAFANLVGDQITGVMNESGLQTGPPPFGSWRSLRRPVSQFVLGGTVDARSDPIRARVYLADVASGLALWTREFQAKPGDEAMLADAAAGAAAEAMYLALEPQAQKGYVTSPQALADHIRGGVLFRSHTAINESGIRAAYERLVVEAPGLALGHGELALILTVEAAASRPPERAALEARADSEARRALRIDPASAGYAYGALALLAGSRDPTNLQAIEQPYRDGVRLQPDFGPFHMRLCDLLTDVGRSREALLACQRAVALRPMASPNAWKYALALEAAGDEGNALRQIEKAARYDPEDNQIRLVRLVILARGDDPSAARAFLRDPRLAPPLPAPARELIDSFIQARETQRVPDVQRAARGIQAAVAAGSLDPGLGVQLLALLGQDEQALEIIGRTRVFHRDLLSPALANVRGDSRFLSAAQRTGLVRYWQTTHTRPDFCAAPNAPPWCAALSASAG